MSTIRYQSQQVLDCIGLEGQARLGQARVLIVGCGGLGCPALQYLVGAGVGYLTLVDADTVDISNLQRQPLYGESNLDQAKVKAARAALENLNPDIEIATFPGWLTPANAEELVDHHDVVLDCADSFAASYILSDYCRDHAIPLISASAIGTSGYAGVFCGNAPSLRAVFPALPAIAASCTTAGVMGPVVGVLGSLQAQMGLSVLLEMKPSPSGQMITFDGQRMAFGGFNFKNAAEPVDDPFAFIDVSSISNTDLVIDLRAESESCKTISANAIRKSVDDFARWKFTPPQDQRTVLCCTSGVRAWKAAELMKQYHDGEIVLVAARLSTKIQSRESTK